MYAWKKAMVLLLAALLAIPISGNPGKVTCCNGREGCSTSSLLEGGWLEERDGVKILHISGSNYEMGYQHGFLLRNETREDLRAFLNDTSLSYDELLEMWNITGKYIPDEYVEELHGIADGAGLRFEDVVAAYMSVITWGMGCFGVAAWGDATIDGKMYFMRSFDLTMKMRFS